MPAWMQVAAHSSASKAELGAVVVNGIGQPAADAAAVNWPTVAAHVLATEPNAGTPAASPLAHAAPIVQAEMESNGACRS
eukprot:129824-Prymnesium_polylepis.2